MPYERNYGPPARPEVPDVRQPFYDGTDFIRQANNNRARAVGQGDMMNQELKNFGDDQDYWNQYWRGQGSDAYGEIAAGRGGYGGPDAEDIIGRRDLDRLQMTPEQRQALFLSGGEEADILGNPNEAAKWFDPEQQDRLNTEGNKRIYENVGESGRSLNNTYNEDALSLSKGYRDELGGLVNSGAANVRGSINRDKLTLDPNFLRDYRMSDRDVDDFTQSAALTQGNVSRGRMDAVRRAAAESGGMSPLALANGLNELGMRGDQQANAAALNARIAAKGMQADRLKTGEGMRLDAEGNYAGMASGAEMGLYDRAYGAARDYERERLGTEQDKQGRRYQIAANVADRGYDAVNQTNKNNVNNSRYIAETGYGVARDTDELKSGRAKSIAGNRQQTEQYGQETEYGRGMDRNKLISTRTAGVADAKRDDSKEYRQWLAGQQEIANGNVNKSFDNRLRNYGQQGQLAQGSTQDAMQYQLGRDSNGFGANFKKNLGSSLGHTLGTGGGQVKGWNVGSKGN